MEYSLKRGVTYSLLLRFPGLLEVACDKDLADASDDSEDVFPYTENLAAFSAPEAS
jgi:hypothetical protein